MHTSEAELQKILAAINLVSAATNTEVALAPNEKIRDGSRVVLVSKEGWFIDVVGARLFEYQHPPLGLHLRGYIHNPKTDLLEALTLHPGTGMMQTRMDVPIETPEPFCVDQIVTKLVPAVRQCAKQLQDRWAAETARTEQIAQLKEHFEIVGSSKKFTHGTHTLELSVCSVASDWNKVGLSLKTDGLSPAQVEAILKVLDDPTLSS